VPGFHVRAEFVLATADLQPLHALRRWMGIIRFSGRDEMDEGCPAERPGTITGTFNRWPQEAYRPGGNQQVAGKRIRAASRAIGDMTVRQPGASAHPGNRTLHTGDLTEVAAAILRNKPYFRLFDCMAGIYFHLAVIGRNIPYHSKE